MCESYALNHEDRDPVVVEPGSELARSLTHVAVTRRTDLHSFPDFFLIGPQRTGTTWLHHVLERHPDINMSFPKEIHYFDSLNRKGMRRFPSDELADYLQQLRAPLTTRWLRHWRAKKHLGRPYKPLLSGESTASYAALREPVITDMVRLNPKLKVIMLVRNPVTRAWSHAKKDLACRQGRRSEDVRDEEYYEFFRRTYQLRCADYVSHYNRWVEHFGEDQVFVRRFEDLKQESGSFFEEVAAFLQIDPNPFKNKWVRDAGRNSSGDTPLPEHMDQHLRVLLAEPITKIKEHFGYVW